MIALLLLLQEEALDAARKAAEKTAASSYYYQVAGKYDRTGEFKPDAVLTCTIRKYRSARNGHLVLVKGPEGLWKAPEERLGEQTENPDKDAADIVATLRDAEPPHKMLLDAMSLYNKGTRGEDKAVDDVRCRVYWFRIPEEPLKDALERQMKKGIDAGELARPDTVHWSSASSTIRVYVDAKNGWLVRFRDERTVKIGYKRSGSEETKLYKVEMEYSFSGWGSAKLNLPPEAAEKLGIKE